MVFVLIQAPGLTEVEAVPKLVDLIIGTKIYAPHIWGGTIGAIPVLDYCVFLGSDRADRTFSLKTCLDIDRHPWTLSVEVNFMLQLIMFLSAQQFAEQIARNETL